MAGMASNNASSKPRQRFPALFSADSRKLVWAMEHVLEKSFVPV